MPSIHAPPGATLGHVGAVGMSSSDTTSSYGYGPHWRCRSIHEVSTSTSFSRRQSMQSSAPEEATTMVAASPAASGAATAPGTARMELLSRMEQLEARRRGGAPSTSMHMPSAASNTAGRLSPAQGRTNHTVGSGGVSVGSAAFGLDAQRRTVAEAIQGSPSSRRGSHSAMSSMGGRSTFGGMSRSGGPLSSAEQRLGSAGQPDGNRIPVAPAWNSNGVARRNVSAAPHAPGWPSSSTEETPGDQVEGEGDGWRVSGSWGYFSGASGPGARARHTMAQPNPDPWWVSRRQPVSSVGAVAAPDRRRCTPPVGSFSLMSGPTDATTLRERATATAAKQESTLQTLQGARLHTLPLRTRAPNRVPSHGH
jgi:hypothetical protein